MQFPLTAAPRAKAHVVASHVRRYLVASLRLLAVAGMIGATCVQIYFISSPAARRRFLACRTALLFAILRVRVEIDEVKRAHHASALLVSNHISWLDALAIQQHFGCSFVVKAEIFSWPIVGRLCVAAQSISIARGSPFGLVPTLLEVNTALSKNQSVGVFSEGTTTGGNTILPFSNGLFQAAITSNVPVQPLFIAYRNSDHSHSYAFVGDDTFLASLWRVCLTAHTVMSIRCLPALAPIGTRRQLCATTHSMITAAHCRHKAVMNEWHDTDIAY